MPKEMLPIVDKPLIQYAVEEALASGIEQIVFVTGSGKSAIENHFDRSFELERILLSRNKQPQLEELETLVPETGTIIYTRQPEPLGLGHAIWCARDVIGKEPFAVLLADDLIKSETPVLRQMLDRYDDDQSSMVAIIEVDPRDTDQYGILDPEAVGGSAGDMVRIVGMEEKPRPDAAKSNLAIIGRYILTPEIFDLLGKKQHGAGGEIQLTDAMAQLLTNRAFFGYRFEGLRFDCGKKAGFQMANLSFAMDRPELREQLVPFIAALLTDVR